MGLSTLARGSTQEKLRWVFSLYDLDGDGVISRNELYRIICAVYDLLGRPDPSPADEAAAMNHADQIFDVSLILTSNLTPFESTTLTWFSVITEV